MKTISQVSIFIENTKGRLANVCGLLGDNNINIKALTIAETPEFGILRVVLNDTEKAKKVLKENGFIAKIAPVVAVEGNMDRVHGDIDLPVSRIIEVEGHKIGIIHGEVYPRGDTQQLYYHALQLEVDILVSGHSHIAQLEKIKNVILVNPGSPTNPRLSDPSVALMEINGNDISIEFIQTGRPVCSALNFFEEKSKKDN